MKRRNFLNLSIFSFSALVLGSCSEDIYSEQPVNTSILEAIKEKYGNIKTEQKELSRRGPSFPYLTRAGQLHGNDLVYLLKNNSTKNLVIPTNKLDDTMPAGYSIEVVQMSDLTKNLPIFKV